MVRLTGNPRPQSKHAPMSTHLATQTSGRVKGKRTGTTDMEHRKCTGSPFGGSEPG